MILEVLGFTLLTVMILLIDPEPAKALKTPPASVNFVVPPALAHFGSSGPTWSKLWCGRDGACGCPTTCPAAARWGNLWR
jgi:hypothetical protein